MKYIDAEKLIHDLEERIYAYSEGHANGDDCRKDAIETLLKDVKYQLSLQQEQPEVDLEDEKMRTNAVLSLMYLIEECPNADFIDSVKKEIAWLKSLRPQPQQNMSIGFMLYLDEHRPDGKMCLSNAECNEIETAFKNQSWDTILRYIEKYQPHWKPSNEQINYLGAAVIEAQRRHNESVNGFPRYRVLKELYEQLLKL